MHSFILYIYIYVMKAFHDITKKLEGTANLICSLNQCKSKLVNNLIKCNAKKEGHPEAYQKDVQSDKRNTNENSVILRCMNAKAYQQIF